MQTTFSLGTGEVGSSVTQSLIICVTLSLLLGLFFICKKGIINNFFTHVQKKERTLMLTSHHIQKVNLKWIKVLNIRNKTIKRKLGKDFFKYAIKSTIYKRKN